jgi:hypothetical protein
MAEFPKIRPLEQQFEDEKVIKIREIQGQFQSLRFPTGAGSYYTKEVINCLEAGLLLAALQVATALLELFVRDLLVAETYKKEFPRGLKKLGKIERDIEDGRPRFDFNRIISELAEDNIIEEEDKEKIYSVYKNVRIPLHHGLTRRFVRSFWKDEIDDEDDDPLVDTLFLRKSGRDRDLEEVLEDHTLDFLIIVADFIMRYLPLTNELLL